jgi:PucR family transcriptional regulator, purine catabolism regulatory protein
MLPTLSDVLALQVMQAGRPQVLTSDASLDRPVRWVQVSELPGVAGMLSGGELILTTGLALPESDRGQREFVAALASSGASALVMELGRRYEQVPRPVIRAGDKQDLPVVALRRPVPFVTVTEDILGLIAGEQYQLLSHSQRAYTELGRLNIEGGTIQSILDKVAELVRHPVVLEDLSHRVLSYSCDRASVASLLDNWEIRSRLAAGGERTEIVGPEGWLVTPVGPRSQPWGRLVLRASGGYGPGSFMILERAAEAVAINRLVESDREGIAQQAHHGVLGDLLDGRLSQPDAINARVEALGIPTANCTYLGIAIQPRAVSESHPRNGESQRRARTNAVTLAMRDCGLAALVGSLDGEQTLALAAIPLGHGISTDPRRLTERISFRLESVGGPGSHVVGIGRPTGGLPDSRTSLIQASYVARVASSLGGASHGRPHYEIADVRLHGLLSSLLDDPRVQAFTEGELGLLLAHDARHSTDLVTTLRQYFEVSGNKSRLAALAQVSRPTLYARLATIERILGVDLENYGSALALQVALLVRQLSSDQ